MRGDDARPPEGADFHADLLADVERHIAEAELHITRLSGRRSSLTAELLQMVEQSLELMREHRRLLLRLMGRDVPEE